MVFCSDKYIIYKTRKRRHFSLGTSSPMPFTPLANVPSKTNIVFYENGVRMLSLIQRQRHVWGRGMLEMTKDSGTECFLDIPSALPKKQNLSPFRLSRGCEGLTAEPSTLY